MKNDYVSMLLTVDYWSTGRTVLDIIVLYRETQAETATIPRLVIFVNVC